MRTLTAAQQTAIAAEGMREAWAVKITLTDSTVLRYTDWPDGVTIGGSAYTAWPLSIGSIPGSSNLREECLVTLADAAGTLKAYKEAGTLRRGTLVVYELIGDALESLELVSGMIVSPSIVGGWCRLRVGRGSALWAVLAPDRFAPECRYRSTAQCTYVASCYKTWTNCGMNGQTAKFGGYRRLPAPGLTIEFRDGEATTNPPVIVVPPIPSPFSAPSPGSGIPSGGGAI